MFTNKINLEMEDNVENTLRILHLCIEKEILFWIVFLIKELCLELDILRLKLLEHLQQLTEQDLRTPILNFLCQCHFRINCWLLKLNLVWVCSYHIYSFTQRHVQCNYILYYNKCARFKVRIYCKCSDIWESLSNCIG